MAYFRCTGNSGGSLKLRTASGDIASFETNLPEPYQSVLVNVEATGGNGTPDNPNPINGYTEANITRCGVNLFDCDSKVSGTSAQVVYTSDDNYIYMNGTKNGGTYATFSGALYSLKKGTYYAKAFFISGTATNDPQLSFILPDGSTTGNIVNGATFTLSEDNTIYPRFAIWTDNTVFSNLKIGIVISTASISEYSEYTGNTYTIAFGQTVYGGVLDVTRGKLHVTWGGVDLGSLAWEDVTSGESPYFRSNVTNYKYLSSNNNVKCSCYSYANIGAVGSDVGFIIISSLQLRIRDNTYPNANAFKTAMQGQIIAYELATPFDIDLTPEVIFALEKNNVFADCGETEVKYLYLE